MERMIQRDSTRLNLVTTWLLLPSLLGKQRDKERNRQKKGEQGYRENDRDR